LRIDLLEPDVLVAAISSCFVTTPVSAMENGPGPQVNAFSPGGGKYCSTTCFANPSHGLSFIPRQTIMVMVPSGLRLARMFEGLRPDFEELCSKSRKNKNRGSV